MTASRLADSLRVVLVRPQSGGNVGSAARALKNFGLRRLVVVAPGPDCKWDEARWLAHGAEDVLEAAPTVATLSAALDGVSVVLGSTARRRRWRSWPVVRPEEAGRLAAEAGPGAEVALVFGSEDAGLTNDELSACTHLVHIPTDPAHPSLNLAQAVVLLVYETSRAVRAAGGRSRPERVVPRATAADLDGTIEQALAVLDRVGWFRGHSAEQARIQLRQVLLRAELGVDDLGFLRGVLRKLAWHLDERRPSP